MMNEDLKKRWDRLAEAHKSYLKLLEGWTEEQLSWRPSAGWSANQLTEHIMTAEMGTLGYMKKKSSSGWDTLEDTGDEHRMKSEAINTRLASNERYQAPSVLPEPTGQYSSEQMKTHWGRQRKEMAQFLESIDPKYYHKLVFKQPMAGMLNILQALEFMYHHVQHHFDQVARIKQEQGI